MSCHTDGSTLRLQAVILTDAGKLLPCPFCGDHNERLPDRLVVEKTLRDGYAKFKRDRDAYSYAVRCSSCAAIGPWCKSSEHGARVMWNTRYPKV